MSQCEYITERDSEIPHPSIAGIENLGSGEKWSCHREAYRDRGYCIFHLPIHQKEAQEVEQALISSMNSSDPDDKKFIGANLESVNIQNKILGNSGSEPLDFRFADLDEVVITGSVVRNPLLLDGSKITKEFNCRWTRFQEPVTANDTVFNSETTFEGATFESSVEIIDSQFLQDFSMSGATIHSSLVLSSCHFEKNAGFWESVFHGSTNFSGTTFDGYGAFAGATFDEDTSFSDITANEVFFSNCEFDSYAAFFSIEIRQTADFYSVTFHDQVVFSDAAFMDGADFTESTIAGGMEMKNLENKNGDIELIFKRSKIHEATLTFIQEEPVKFDFTRALLGDVDINSEQTSNPFEYILIDRTDFVDFDFSNYRSELEQDWMIHSYDGQKSINTPSHIETTYLKAKRGAGSVGDTHAESAFLIKEMKYRRAKYKSWILSSDFPSWMQLRAGVKYISNLLFEMSSKYGESPRNTIVSSAIIVLAFSFLYRVLLRPTETSLLESVILSFQSFVALLAGVPPFETSILQITAALEAFFGAFFVALFVVTLTRTAHR